MTIVTQVYVITGVIAAGVNSNQSVCKIVIHDRIGGFLNWLQDWFKQALKDKCPRPVVILDGTKEIASADYVIFHAPTHTRLPSTGKGSRTTITTSSSSSSTTNKHKKKMKKKGPLRVMVSMEQPK